MLRSLDLQPVYDSADHDLVQDLIVPLLANSQLYLRGVGYFSSGWLRLAVQGLSRLVENGGKAKIVVSPIMEKSDWEAIQRGDDARHNDVLRSVLEKSIESLATALETDTLNALAWMICDDVLDFRFAVAREGFAGGDYHDKVAVFTDELGDRVAIHGSFNDSVKASLNGEAFSVFKSWEDGQKPFVEQHHRRLDELWERGNRQFKVFRIPEAAREKLIKLRSKDSRPYHLPPRIEPTSMSGRDEPHCSVRLYDYQKEAIQSWTSSNCQGVFEMATGTGKTFTSLACAINRYETLGRLAVVIIVPYLHLIDQWKDNCEAFNFRPILCSSAHSNWQLQVKQKIQDFNIKAVDNICILAVHKTAATGGFAKAVSGLKPESTMLIGDEVHGLGSKVLRQAMISNAGMRLGLSATPKRWFDDKGTEAMFSYFGPICVEFPLEKAIGQYLTRYEYRPELVSLSEDEMQQYEALTSRIAKLVKMNAGTEDMDDRLKILLMERATLVSSAVEKQQRLVAILKQLMQEADKEGRELRHILVYCAPGSHRDILTAVAHLGLRCREFVHTVPMDERQKILTQFTKGDVQVIVAVKCLDEGVDIPATRMAFLLASTSNPREFVQRRGRVLRLADGKEKATIYDFIVVPREDLVPLKRDVDASLLKREMPRFAEFACSASNEFEARTKIRPILDQYEMLGLLDQRPWDIYHKLAKADDSMIFSE
ncbi:MAG: DEAD/DEAH box helicase family protein [Dehalococcoidia bacterium]